MLLSRIPLSTAPRTTALTEQTIRPAPVLEATPNPPATAVSTATTPATTTATTQATTTPAATVSTGRFPDWSTSWLAIAESRLLVQHTHTQTPVGVTHCGKIDRHRAFKGTG